MKKVAAMITDEAAKLAILHWCSILYWSLLPRCIKYRVIIIMRVNRNADANEMR